MKSFEVFFESCKYPEIRQCQILDIGRVWSNFNCDALYLRWIGSTNMGSEIVVLKNHLFLPGRTRFIRFFQPLYDLHVSLGDDFRRFPCIISSNICLFKSLDALTGLPGRGRSFRSKFPPLSSNVTTQRRIHVCPQYLHHRKPINAVTSGRSSIFVGENTPAARLMPFETVENESHILNWIHRKPNTYSKTCVMANLSPRNLEQVGKLAQVPLQGEATCARHLLGGITFRTFRTTRVSWR